VTAAPVAEPADPAAIALIRADETLLASYWLHVGADPRSSGLTDEAEAARYLLWFATEGWRQHQQVMFSAELLRWLAAPAGRVATRLAAHVLASQSKQTDAAREGQPTRFRNAEGGLDLKTFHAWYYLQGVDELGLAPLISAAERSALHAPAKSDAGTGHSRLSAMHAHLARLSSGHGSPRDDPAWFEQVWLPQASPWLRIAPMKTGEAPLAATLFGFTDGVLGVGEDVRMMAATLLRAGAHVAIHSVDIPRGVGESAPHGWGTLCVDRPLFGTSLFCLPPFEMKRLKIRHGAHLFAGRRNIGVWPWELPTLPPDWLSVFDDVDEIWAISRYLADAFGALTGKPVRHVPPHVAAPTLSVGARDRAAFVAITFCDFNSFASRKNPQGAIEAFRLAFPDQAGREQLIVKTLNAARHGPAADAMRAAAEGDPRILFRDEALSRNDTLALIAGSDCLISLHRAEGFGRTPAEAMRLGVPVVATGWSGSADLLDETTGWPVPYRLRRIARGEYIYTQGSHWAEPHIGAAARALAAIRADRDGEVARRVAAAKARVEALCGLDACASRAGLLLRGKNPGDDTAGDAAKPSPHGATDRPATRPHGGASTPAAGSPGRASPHQEPAPCQAPARSE
jgi:glycosyltransferase involved in cell wall biosynthesis